MAFINKVLLMGNLTRDPEMRFLPSQMAVVNIGVAVNRRWKNQQTGEWQEEATFVDCEAFGKTAEFVNQWFKKGRPIFVEGRLKLDQWQDKEGQNRSKMKVVIENVQFADSKGGDGAPQGDGGGAPPQRSNRPQQRPAGNRPAPSNMPPQDGEPHQAVEEDDIPF